MSLVYVEEAFGILTDDNLYLDCILVKPAKADDASLKALRVWVPKYPLTKTSVVACARQEVQSAGPEGKIAHLIFDLRGTGDSEGSPGDLNFQMDLYAVAAWAKERFGKINFGFLGTPSLENGRVYMWPLRPGAIMESYYYPSTGTRTTPTTILYLATYGNFSVNDDLFCQALAESGYAVYGLDPLRYLLHACFNRPLSPEDLAEDLRLLIQMLPSKPIVVAQPLAAGLGIMWASLTEEIRGIIAIGRAQLGLRPSHIFHNPNPYTYLLSRHTPKIAPRPLALVLLKGHPQGGDDDEMATLYQNSKDPHRMERLEKLSPQLLLNLLAWVQEDRT